jgi:hypothetical protein
MRMKNLSEPPPSSAVTRESGERGPPGIEPVSAIASPACPESS